MRRYLPVRMMSTSVPCVARSKSQDAGPASVECPDMSDLKGLAAAEWAGRVLAETASGREAVRAFFYGFEHGVPDPVPGDDGGFDAPTCGNWECISPVQQSWVEPSQARGPSGGPRLRTSSERAPA
jgi:hypothetical protein